MRSNREEKRQRSGLCGTSPDWEPAAPSWLTFAGGSCFLPGPSGLLRLQKLSAESREASLSTLSLNHRGTFHRSRARRALLQEG